MNDDSKIKSNWSLFEKVAFIAFESVAGFERRKLLRIYCFPPPDGIVKYPGSFR
jgi:hypothetical protein